VDNACLLVKIIKSIEHLSEVVPRKSLTKTALSILGLNEGEQIALLEQLKHNKENLDALAAAFDHEFPLGVGRDILDDVAVLEGLEEAHLVGKDTLECRQTYALDLMALNNFNRE